MNIIVSIMITNNLADIIIDTTYKAQNFIKSKKKTVKLQTKCNFVCNLSSTALECFVKKED